MKLSEDRIGEPICRSLKTKSLQHVTNAFLKSHIISPNVDVTPLQHGGAGFDKSL